MTEFYLITGFLGAGKTTLLKSIIPMFQGKSIKLIINEFGRVGLDGTQMREYGAEITEIVNGSIFCVCRLDQFENALNEAMTTKPDVILVETSGLSDPGAIRSILAEHERAGLIAYRGAICLADAKQFPKVIDTARACRKQLAVADLVLLNKCDLVSEETCASIERLIGSLCLAPILRTTYGAITREQLDQLAPMDHAAVIDQRPDLTLQKETIAINRVCNSHQVRRMLALLAEDTYRMKGLLDLSDGKFIADCVGSDILITQYAGRMEHVNSLTLLAGEGMALRRALKQLILEYGDQVYWKKGNGDD